jgi:hypothetical protein
MPFFRSPIPALLAGILFAGTGAVFTAATARTPKRRGQAEPCPDSGAATR